ncbi:M-phase-specific PLK1-interacting protein [Antennarius striatus]|uniref:M-phase-specific PLK1-interacting protein n=1 Tax=Antennarius striatus TaxID=241820 RepID=UPI0035B01C02
MYRPPSGPPRGPGGSSFPPPAWGFPRTRSPYGGSGYRGGPTRSGHPYPYRGHSDSPPVGPGNGSRGFHTRRQSGAFRRPVGPAPRHGHQAGAPDAPVEKYFSPSMLQDPWVGLRPVSAAERRGRR